MSGYHIAIACSGLGHIHRGIETWAADISQALHKREINISLFQGAGHPNTSWIHQLPCCRRYDSKTQSMVRHFRKLGGWRYGLGSEYQIEQSTFTFHLWKKIYRDYDILHVKDPQIALIMERLNRVGLSKPQVILSHGTEENVPFLQRFSYLQHLAPCYLEAWEKYRPEKQMAFSIPNFVDVNRFSPADKNYARKELGLPSNSFIVFSAAAIKRAHKRIDYLINEFASFARNTNQPVFLLIAGGRENDSDELIAEGNYLLKQNVKFILNIPQDRMPLLYQAADVFAISSLQEMFGTVMIEALATGLPVACNSNPVTKWIVGPAGILSDISKEGALAEQFHRLLNPTLRNKLSAKAREHVLANFSEEIVVRQILEMYNKVMKNKK